MTGGMNARVSGVSMKYGGTTVHWGCWTTKWRSLVDISVKKDIFDFPYNEVWLHQESLGYFVLAEGNVPPSGDAFGGQTRYVQSSELAWPLPPTPFGGPWGPDSLPPLGALFTTHRSTEPKCRTKWSPAVLPLATELLYYLRRTWATSFPADGKGAERRALWAWCVD
eukprot:1195857-Prorocentrum_minimum.AAC.2